MAQYTTNSEFDSPIRKLAVGYLFCVLILFYLAFHTVSGERGIFALLRESRKLDALKTEVQETKAKREVLEKKVQKLSNNSLDLDLLDEQARKVLGTTGKNEVVLFFDSDKSEK